MNQETQNPLRTALEQMCLSANAASHELDTTHHTLESRESTPTEQALYRKSVAMHAIRIADIEATFSVTVVTSSATKSGHLPYSEKINVKQTLVNFDNHR